MYEVSLFAAASATGGKLIISIGGVQIQELELNQGANYRSYVSQPFYASQGSSLKLAVKGSPNGWVNIDAAVLRPAREQSLTIESSNPSLNEAFRWAKRTALAYVQTDTDPAHIPSYWAGYPHRPAFYGRDVAHQMLGAYLLGLEEENISMMRTFAASATAGRKFYPLWAFEFNGSDYEVDYKSDTNFVRELPTPFELVEKSYEQYLWSSNSAWLYDTVLANFYKNTVSDFVNFHDENQNGIADEIGNGNIFEGVATYNEQGDHLREAADALGAQYKAYLAYARMAEVKGQSSEALEYNNKAVNLLAAFHQNWWAGDKYYRGFDKDWAPVDGWGKETSFFIPLKFLSAPGNRMRLQLDHIQASVDMGNIESYTYLPEIFWPHGDVERAWGWLKHYAGTRDPYPELSYTIVGQLVALMGGLEPNAPMHKVASFPQLPTEVKWISLNKVPLGSHTVDVTHKNNVTTTLKHTSGSSNLTWRARFKGSHPQIYVNGAPQVANSETLPAGTVSYVDIQVGTGITATAQVPAIVRHSSGKCITAGANPQNEEFLRFANTCNAADSFILLPNQMLKHVVSGYCVHPLGGTADANVKLVLFNSCTPEARLKLEHTEQSAIRHTQSNMCVHPEGGSANPNAGTYLVYYPGCNEERLKFGFVR